MMGEKISFVKAREDRFATIPSKEYTIEEALGIVSSNKYKDIITEIRNKKTKKERDSLKKKLDYFIFGGTFTSRKNKNLIKSSGVVCWDFDNLKDSFKETLIKDEYVLFCFSSPSGNGFKVGIKIPEVKNDDEYKQYWNAISSHFDIKETDEKTKDISRACFVSYDDNLYFNPDSKLFDAKIENKIRKAQKHNSNDDPFIKSIKDKWNEGDRQDLAMSVAGYLRKSKRLGLNSALDIVEEIARDCEDTEISQRLAAVRATYDKDESKIKGVSGLIEKEINIKKNNPSAIFGAAGQVERFYELQPFFYDRSGIFFVWNKEEKKYDMVDDIDMLNGVAGLGVDTISSKSKTEIKNALQQYGRKKIPKKSPLSWIQFKDKIYDFKKEEEFEASPEYFITSPIPYSPSDSSSTPTIDKLFIEWVGEDYVDTLYEIIAYSSCSDQFMQRMIALVGGGSNGKGTYSKLINKFLGNDNTTTSELKELCASGFETSMIYKKLVCFFGEIMQGDLKNSNRIKTLAGEDQVRFCFKGKTPFKDDSITTLIALTNSLPRTPDKTMGFYRKWLIVDFPNQFTNIKNDVIAEIPEDEFNNLARKILITIKKLYSKQAFTNEGTFQERMDRYEARSNPVVRFIESNCEDDYDSYVSVKEFTILFNKYLKENHLRPMNVKEIKKTLSEEGFNISRTDRNGIKDFYILCLKIKDLDTKTEKTEKTEIPKSKTTWKSSEKKVSKVSKVSEKPTFCQKCNAPMIEKKCIGGCE